MPFTTYAELQTEVASLLARSDLTSQVPGFISLAEGTLRRTLRRKKVRSTAFSIDSVLEALPATCAELSSIRLITATPSLDLPLKQTTPDGLAEMTAGRGALAGRPRAFTIIGSDILFDVAPDQTYTAEIVYYQKYLAVSTDTTLLVESPDLYLYGAALHAAPWLQHDERIPMWTSLFGAARDEINVQREAEENSAGIRPARLSRVF